MIFLLFLELCLTVFGERLSPQSMLAIHNYYRCMHGVTPVAWNASLQASAEMWAANRNAAGCVMQHSGYKGIGENVAAGGIDMSKPNAYYWTSDMDVAHAWYNESWVYNVSTGYNHFSQVVWNRTYTIGCAWTYCDSKKYEFWVCQYYPPGNYAGQNNQNVPAPCRPQADCMYTFNGINLTTKFASQAKQDQFLYPNQINVSAYTYDTSKCWYKAQTTSYAMAGSVCYDTNNNSAPSNGNAGNCAYTHQVNGSFCSMQCNSGYYASAQTLQRTCMGDGMLSAMPITPINCQSSGNGKSTAGMAAGIVIAVVLVLVGALVGYTYYKRKQGSYSAAATSVPETPVKSPNSNTVTSPTPTSPPLAAPTPGSPTNGGWEKHMDDNTKTYYYYNPKNGVTQWDKPAGYVD